jgi:uncharacterized protein (DUF2249 family)
MSETIVTLDVREDIRSGQQPCGKIMDTAKKLRPDETLRLIAPFEPVPLFELLGKQGFHHTARPISAGDWEVLFTRTSRESSGEQKSVVQPCGCGCSSLLTADIVEVDARGLEPPQPMVKILEALNGLADGAALRARTDRRPIHLYAMLDARGFTALSEEQSDGSFITHIRRS